MLSEDEREAIERLKAQLNFWKKQNIKNSDCEIILNLITKLQKENVEKDKEIEKLKADNKKAWKLNANMTQRHLSDIFKIKKKDKQIDLMATTLSAICTGLSTVRDHFEKAYCEFINSNKDCCWKTDTSCKDCIKQYFERKVSE